MHLTKNRLIVLLTAYPFSALGNSLLPIEEVEVTAYRTHGSINTTPAAITTLNQRDIKKNRPRNIPEAISKLPGVLLQKTANGHGSPFIRGFTGYRTLTLIDDVRYNNSVYRDGPNEYFSLIDINTINQISVISGPSSASYGSDAIGGTIHLKTQSSAFRNKDHTWFARGSHDYHYNSAHHSHKNRSILDIGQGQNWGLLLGYSNNDYGNTHAAKLGKLPTTDYSEHAFDARLDIQLNDFWLLTYNHQQLNQDDVWRTHSTIYAKSFAGTTVGKDKKRLKDQYRQLDYLKLTALTIQPYIDEFKLTLSTQSWQEKAYRIKSKGEGIHNQFDSTMYGLDLQINSQINAIQWVYGLDYYKDNVDSSRKDFNTDGSLDKIRIQGPIGDNATYHQLGIFLQSEFYLNDATELQLSTRFNKVSANIGAFENPKTKQTDTFKDSWQAWVNSIKLSYETSHKTFFWFSINEAFRAPNIGDISRYGKSRSNEIEIAATNLSPEAFTSYEIGLKKNSDNFNIHSSFYITDIKNFITSTATGNTVDQLIEVSKKNSAKGQVTGIEINVENTLSSSWTIKNNLTWLKGDLKNPSLTQASEPMSRIMPLTLNSELHWNNPVNNQWIIYSLTYAKKAKRLSTADQQDTQRIPPKGTPAYLVFNIKGGYSVNDKLDIELGINNLFNQAYRSHGSGTNEAGRGINAGFSLKF